MSRCQCQTQAGHQCSREAALGSRFCSQHAKKCSESEDCELGEGYDVVDRLSMSLNNHSLNEIYLDEKPITKRALDLPFAHCDGIQLELLDVVAQDGETVRVDVEASNGQYVSVRDVLQAYIDNNNKNSDIIEGSGGYYEGIQQQGARLFSMF